MKPTRPISATLIAWMYILQSAGMGINCLVIGLMCVFSEFPSGLIEVLEEIMEEDCVPRLKLIILLLKLTPLSSILGVAYGILGVYAGIALLKLRCWGRVVLECMTWLSILSLIYPYSLFSVFPSNVFFSTGFVVMLVVMTILQFSFIALIIYCLRGKKLRVAIREQVTYEQGEIVDPVNHKDMRK